MGVEFVISLQIPVYIDLMTYAENRNLREEVYRAYISRASNIGITSKEFDNRDVMKNILELRSELSKLLDFSNYAELSIKSLPSRKIFESVKNKPSSGVRL